MAKENLNSGWVLVDEEGATDYVIVSPHKATFTELKRRHEIHNSKDHTTNHFGDFVHSGEFQIDDTSHGVGGTTVLFPIWGVMNTPNSWMGMFAGNEAISCFVYTGSTKKIFLHDHFSDNNDGMDNLDVPVLAKDVLYRWIITRDGTDLELKVYEWFESSTWLILGTWSIVCSSATKRYVVNLAGHDNVSSNPDHWVTGFVQNLDINEYDPSGSSIISSSLKNLIKARARIL